MVHFAPSAAAFVTPVLCKVFGVAGEETRIVKVAAIGLTTASYLVDTLDVQVDVVSPKPTPDALCSAMVAYDEGTR